MIRRLLPAIALLTLCLFAAPRPVAAFDFFKGAGCAKNPNSTVCQSQKTQSQNIEVDANGNPILDAKGHTIPINPLTGPGGILAHITNIVAFAAGAAAVIIIIISALKLITSGSNVSTGSRTDTDVEDARRGLANAVIGLVVIVLARTIIIYIVNRL